MKKLYLILPLLPFFAFSQVEKSKDIKGIVFQKKKKSTDLTNTAISTKDARQVATVSGGIEGIIKTLPSVNSNTELSSQYMVRGGNYDENLIYVNDIELYRPFLIRNAQQEGMSVINPDMVSAISFSPGGFEARYGDKMSSALNIYYREPRRNELSGAGSLIGSRLSVGVVSKDRKLAALVSGRYRNTNLVLNTLNEDTDFNPQYLDVQSYINYHFSPKWTLSFLGYYSKNDYRMVPKKKTVNFGTLQQPITLNVFYGGQEADSYKNMMGTVSLNFKPNKKWQFILDNFAYQNREREYFSIGSAYQILSFDPQTGAPLPSYDLGGQIDHARNDLLVKTVGSQLKARYSPNANSDIEVGLKYEKEFLKDNTNEWQLVDSLGYSKPRAFLPPGQLDTAPLKLRYHIHGVNEIRSVRLSGYAQLSKKFYIGEAKAYINAGVRAQNWSYNKQSLISPRLQFALKPDWEQDMLFRISGGIYYQSPYYKEIKNLDGQFDPNIKAQKSMQVIVGNDYEFQMAGRPFKLTTEIYYKGMNHLIPYYIDNVRVRYSGNNSAKGYAYGVDTRLYGQFVPGVDSWISASYARSFENIDGRGYIPRPTDQRFRFAMFYQDYMPKFPSMRVNLTLVYASGLPNGAVVFADPYQYQKRLPAYRRVDIGLSKIFIDQNENKAYGNFWRHFRELSLGVQVFNAFNINNTISNQWINDINTGYVYPVPVRLTGRFFNVKLNFKL
ncbi:TonB-dependent receptor plug domain-containing protein [Riemerella columbipharyngis]|uniref:Outer membrane receptor proteins, mostly Fe transport n=1 Tax=Riemerella columbipharyngis TaxID=1071918 RepID=A0A1G7C4I4_9FLAO|nr:TonB-dependent receptor plug domain-containing protein [Riemerella columbipharyngis]SDE34207.1 Outer membrane receptor proteins, mostly Fe transport [Riemerella columbipharyngis]